MLTIALTGGIGSGKTTVSDRFAELGAGVIDTDLLSRELTVSPNPVLDQIAAVFGEQILDADGALDRVQMRQLVFQDSEARAKLEAILHPAIKTLMLQRLAALKTPYAILVIPLLLETGQQDLADRVLVVDVPESVQIERVKRRSGLDEAEIRRILSSQVSRQERTASADDCLDNSGDPSALLPQIQRLHTLYLALAAARAQRS